MHTFCEMQALVGHISLSDRVSPLWDGCRESRRYSRNTYPESYVTKYISIRRYVATAVIGEELRLMVWTVRFG